MDPDRSTVSRAFFMANWREAAAASREDMISQTSFVVKLSSAMGIDDPHCWMENALNKYDCIVQIGQGGL